MDSYQQRLSGLTSVSQSLERHLTFSPPEGWFQSGACARWRVAGGGARLSPADRLRSGHHDGSIVPAAHYIEPRLNAATVREWDISSSLGPLARLANRSSPSSLLMPSRSLAAGSVRWALWPGPGPVAPVRYRLQVKQAAPLRADPVVDHQLSWPSQSFGDSGESKISCHGALT